jgi:hypothetical protein
VGYDCKRQPRPLADSYQPTLDARERAGIAPVTPHPYCDIRPISTMPRKTSGLAEFRPDVTVVGVTPRWSRWGWEAAGWATGVAIATGLVAVMTGWMIR